MMFIFYKHQMFIIYRYDVIDHQMIYHHDRFFVNTTWGGSCCHPQISDFLESGYWSTVRTLGVLLINVFFGWKRCTAHIVISLVFWGFRCANWENPCFFGYTPGTRNITKSQISGFSGFRRFGDLCQSGIWTFDTNQDFGDPQSLNIL